MFATFKRNRGLTFVASTPDYQLMADDRGQLVRVYQAEPQAKGSYDSLLDRIAELSRPVV